MNDPFKTIKAQKMIKNENKFIVKFAKNDSENLSENYGLHIISNTYHEHLVELSKVTEKKINII